MAVALLTAALGCGESSNGESGFDAPRPGALYPYVRYLAGPGSNATDVRIDLDTADIRVGLGPIDMQSVRRDTLQPNEVETGRELFVEARLTHYSALSDAADGGESTGGAGGATSGEEEDPEAADPDVDDNAPGTDRERSSDATQVTVIVPPGTLNKVFLSYPAGGVQDDQVSEMLSYLADLAVSYEP